MLESTPGAPYTGCVRDLVLVEANMRLRWVSTHRLLSFRAEKVDELAAGPTRRRLARSNLKPNQIPMTLTSFPRLGVPGKFTEPYYDPTEAVSSHSLFLPEQVTNPHARFPCVLFCPLCAPDFVIDSRKKTRFHRTLTANIRRRRKSKVAINLPIFIDDRTPRPFVDPTIPWQRNVFPEDAGGGFSELSSLRTI